jgi:hypothetical protein
VRDERRECGRLVQAGHEGSVARVDHLVEHGALVELVTLRHEAGSDGGRVDASDLDDVVQVRDDLRLVDGRRERTTSTSSGCSCAMPRSWS